MALAVLLVGRLQIPGELVGGARQVLIISGLAIAASFVGGVFSGVVSALQRFDLGSGIEIGI